MSRHLLAGKRGLQALAKAKQRQRMNLRDTRFADAQDRTDLFHGEFLIVVKREDLLLFLVQLLDGADQQLWSSDFMSR